MTVADFADECGEWDVEALTSHPVSAFTDHVKSSRMRLSDFFKIIDARTNAHGRLSDANMVQALQEMGIPLSDDQIVNLVKQMEHEKPDGKITFASLKRTMERHRVSVVRPMKKERNSWINHPLRKYSITTGHRKPEASAAHPDGGAAVADDDVGVQGGDDDDLFFDSDGEQATNPSRVQGAAADDIRSSSNRLSPNGRVSAESWHRRLRRSSFV